MLVCVQNFVDMRNSGDLTKKRNTLTGGSGLFALTPFFENCVKTASNSSTDWRRKLRQKRNLHLFEKDLFRLIIVWWRFHHWLAAVWGSFELHIVRGFWERQIGLTFLLTATLCVAFCPEKQMSCRVSPFAFQRYHVPLWMLSLLFSFGLRLVSVAH